MTKLSVVIPCYNSSKTVESVVMDTIDELSALGYDYEFLLVNDCSPDGGKTLAVLYHLAEVYPFVKVINLGKNAGQHNAIMAGLNYASGDFIVAMDDDGQTRPSEIKKLMAKMDEGYDIVYGYYETKKESLFRRFASAVNHYTIRILLQKPKWLKTSSFWIIRRFIKDVVIQYRHPNVHLQGVFLRVSDNIASVPIDHFARTEGRSGYTLKKLLSLYGSIIGFSMFPLYCISVLGMITALAGFIVDIVVIIRKIIDPTVVSGWSSLIGTICLFSGIILLSLGIVGIYIGRILLGQTDTPQYIVKDTRNL